MVRMAVGEMVKMGNLTTRPRDQVVGHHIHYNRRVAFHDDDV